MPRMYAVLVLALSAAALLAAASGIASGEQTVIFSEDFDDGDWTSGTFWIASPADPSVSISEERSASSPYALKVAAANAAGAIRASSGLRAADQPYTCTFNLYVEAIPEEGIPWCLMDAGGGVVALIFLMPGGNVELTTWKAEGGYIKSVVPYTMTYGEWHAFRVTYDGSTQRLFIDGATEPDASVALAYRAAPARISVGNFQLAHTGSYYIDDITISAESVPQGPPGKVYVQFCSDTSTGGLNTSQNPIRFPSDDSSYLSPTGQAAQVMAEPYRTALRDSLGNTLKITWYMNCGSIYSCGVDTTPILPYELLEDNHGDAIARWGDEMAYHYHTWAWTDPDSDGVFQWNQTETFLECLTDFDQTIAQLVLDRGFYPSSFRSGWNWMDAAWEQYLDELIPYRFEGRWFAQGWVPYHPSAANFRVPGDLRGWEAYYDYTPAFTESKVEDVFMLAANGVDQVVTLYSHLKETDFADRISDVCGYFAAAHERHPEVEFEYLTARDCMLKWRRGSDTTPPTITVAASDSGGIRTAVFTADEDVYQTQPFVARKGMDGVYSRIPCAPVGPNSWTVSYDPGDTMQISVAVTDWFGNSAVKALPVPLRMGAVSVSAESTTAEVRWETTLPATTRLECALMPEGGTEVITDTTPFSPHRATFSGLLPGRVYRIGLTAETASGDRVSAPDSYVLTRLADGTVVDNIAPGFSVTSGLWSTGTTAAGHYGSDYRYASTSATGTSSVLWTMTAPAGGLYKVYAWWSQGANRSTEAPYSVLCRGLSIAATVNQQLDGGVWSPLGTFPLDADEIISVRLTNVAPPGSVVIADAVKLQQDYPAVAGPGLARLLPDGPGIQLDGLIVTAVFDGDFYAQAADRSAGIKVQCIGVSEGDRVTVCGNLGLLDGERVIVDPVVTVQSSGAPPIPLSVSNAACEGSPSPPSTAGMLVSVCGRVAQVESAFFTLADGSGAPMRVESSRLAETPAPGTFVVVKGVHGALLVEGAPMPLIRPRGSGDLVVVLP